MTSSPDGLPVLLHQGHSGRGQKSKYGHPMYVDSAAADYPEVNFVLGHSARWETWSDEAFSVAIFKTNVYLDMSLWQHWASPDEICKKVLWLRDRVGIDRVLFGSDMAGIEVSWTLKEWVDQVRLFPELAKQHGSRLDQDELDMLLGLNALRLYGLEPPNQSATRDDGRPAWTESRPAGGRYMKPPPYRPPTWGRCSGRRTYHPRLPERRVRSSIEIVLERSARGSTS